MVTKLAQRWDGPRKLKNPWGGMSSKRVLCYPPIYYHQASFIPSLYPPHWSTPTETNPNSSLSQAMSPGPVVDAPANAEAEQQVPPVDETTQKKKPHPQVPLLFYFVIILLFYQTCDCVFLYRLFGLKPFLLWFGVSFGSCGAIFFGSGGRCSCGWGREGWWQRWGWWWWRWRWRRWRRWQGRWRSRFSPILILFFFFFVYDLLFCLSLTLNGYLLFELLLMYTGSYQHGRWLIVFLSLVHFSWVWVEVLYPSLRSNLFIGRFWSHFFWTKLTSGFA